jgi:hypothetical protein
MQAGASRVYVRYLPKGVAAGDAGLDYPFVATFKSPRAFDVVSSAARQPGAVVRRLSGSGLAVQNRPGEELVQTVQGGLPAPPVFFAYPGNDALVEVYDRSPARALALVTSGRIRPVR